jgi:anti-sigma B factor antagonist
MLLEIRSEEGAVVVALPRRFDTDTAPKIEEELRPVLDGRPQALLLDFAGTDYISSAGMRAVRGIQHAVTEAGGIFAIASLNHHVSYVFEITGFTKVFTIYPDKEKALRKMKKAR